MVNRWRWLSLTPEPENELPRLVATLAEGGPPTPERVAREQTEVEALILRGNRARWMAYLHRAVELIDRHAGTVDGELDYARERAIRVIANHHNLLLGVSPGAAKRTARDREHLDQELRLRDVDEGPHENPPNPRTIMITTDHPASCA
jgi:hypothetical protein